MKRSILLLEWQSYSNATCVKIATKQQVAEMCFLKNLMVATALLISAASHIANQ